MNYPNLQDAMKMSEWVAMHLHTKTDPKEFEVAAALVVLANEIKLLKDAAAKKNVFDTPLKKPEPPKVKIPEIIPNPIKEKPYLPVKPTGPWDRPNNEPSTWPPFAPYLNPLVNPPGVTTRSCGRCGLKEDSIEYYGCQDSMCPRAHKMITSVSPRLTGSHDRD